jgi:hypothetical protein
MLLRFRCARFSGWLASFLVLNLSALVHAGMASLSPFSFNFKGLLSICLVAETNLFWEKLGNLPA